MKWKLKITQQQLAERLKAARLSSSLTQEKLAEVVGVPRTAICKIEAATQNISTLELARWAEATGRSIASLFE